MLSGYPENQQNLQMLKLAGLAALERIAAIGDLKGHFKESQERLVNWLNGLGFNDYGRSFKTTSQQFVEELIGKGIITSSGIDIEKASAFRAGIVAKEIMLNHHFFNLPLVDPTGFGYYLSVSDTATTGSYQQSPVGVLTRFPTKTKPELLLKDFNHVGFAGLQKGDGPPLLHAQVNRVGDQKGIGRRMIRTMLSIDHAMAGRAGSHKVMTGNRELATMLKYLGYNLSGVLEKNKERLPGAFNDEIQGLALASRRYLVFSKPATALAKPRLSRRPGPAGK